MTNIRSEYTTFFDKVNHFVLLALRKQSDVSQYHSEAIPINPNSIHLEIRRNKHNIYVMFSYLEKERRLGPV